MHHDRLSHVALMSIEYDILRDNDFDILITKFARAKSRKVSGLEGLGCEFASVIKDNAVWGSKVCHVLC